MMPAEITNLFVTSTWSRPYARPNGIGVGTPGKFCSSSTIEAVVRSTTVMRPVSGNVRCRDRTTARVPSGVMATSVGMCDDPNETVVLFAASDRLWIQISPLNGACRCRPVQRVRGLEDRERVVGADREVDREAGYDVVSDEHGRLLRQRNGQGGAITSVAMRRTTGTSFIRQSSPVGSGQLGSANRTPPASPYPSGAATRADAKLGPRPRVIAPP